MRNHRDVLSFRSVPPPATLALALSALLFLAGCHATDRAATANANASPAAASASPDVFVLLSGGGTPTSNNYSQYVQARALAGFLHAHYPPESVWIFFGAGNRDGEPPMLADVYRQTKDNNLLLDTWLPGSLPSNRIASKANFLRTLRNDILPRVRRGGTLHLIVGDHGELTGGKNSESAITMWGLRPDSSRPRGWTPTRDSALTVAELRSALASGLGAGRVVFVMTQCHSGGFHELGVPTEVQPPRTWFTQPPLWLGAAPKRHPRAAGFTATDAASIAAGCDPYADPDTWVGYERFFPENLLGRDLLPSTRANPTPPPAASFFDAHTAATLADHTLDKPRATSEHYLERWATLIESQLSKELLLTDRVRAAAEAYRTAVDTGRPTPGIANPAWQETHARFARHVARMIEQNAATKPLLLSGARAELEAATDPRAPRLSAAAEHDHDAAPSPRLTRSQTQAWREVIRPAWASATAAGTVAGLPAAAAAFERRLQAVETRRPVAFSDSWPDRALDELYWSSTYALPARSDPATAAAVTRWAAERRAVMLAWAAGSPDAALREAAGKFPAAFHRPRTPPPPPRTMEIESTTAAERTLFYRRVLAAWSFLLALDHRPALAELEALQALERTALPPSRPAATAR